MLPGRLWNCGGPGVAEAVERLDAVADDVAARTSRHNEQSLASSSFRCASAMSYGALVAYLSLLVSSCLPQVSLSVGYAPLDIARGASPTRCAGRSTPRRAGAGRAADSAHDPRRLVGFSLGIAGAAMQGLLRNPLAEPGITGVSGMAALGAVIVFYFGLAGACTAALPLGGIAGAAVATFMLYGIAGQGAGTMTLILAGVAINSFAGALTSLALNLAPNPFAVTEIVYWLLGSLADRSLQYVWLVLPLMVVGWIMLLMTGPALDSLTLGEDTAASMGFNLGAPADAVDRRHGALRRQRGRGHRRGRLRRPGGAASAAPLGAAAARQAAAGQRPWRRGADAGGRCRRPARCRSGPS